MVQYKTNQFAFQMNCSMFNFYYKNPVYFSKCSIKENNKKNILWNMLGTYYAFERC